MDKLFGKYEVLPLEEDEEELFEDKHEEYLDTMAPSAPDTPEEEELVFKIEDKGGNIIAGCICDISNWSNALIDLLWVDEQYRRRGLASLLLREAERAARKRGCYLSILDTFDFEARPLYEKHGYTVQYVRENWPKDHCNYTMTKRLDKPETKYMPANHSVWDRYEIKPGTEEEADALCEKYHAHRDSAAPREHDYVNLNKKVLDEKGNTIAVIEAGVSGWNSGAVHLLWVEEPYRNQGIGAYLLSEVGKEMKENGAYVIFLEACDWAVDFFKKNGYTVNGFYEDFPRGHRLYDLKKVF